ncbi:MAG: hypothetical protein ACRDKZ_03970 [Actinomycetota bacterium]
MRISVSAPGNNLTDVEVERIHQDLDKIDRRLKDFREEVAATVRITDMDGAPGSNVVLEVDYGRTHLIAKAAHGDLGQAVREAREEILRQINDRTRRGHSSFSRNR